MAGMEDGAPHADIVYYEQYRRHTPEWEPVQPLVGILRSLLGEATKSRPRRAQGAVAGNWGLG